MDLPERSSWFPQVDMQLPKETGEEPPEVEDTGFPHYGEWVDVECGVAWTCGLKKDGMVECWGIDYYNATPPPNELFASISLRGVLACGITALNEAICWDLDGVYKEMGLWKQVATSTAHEAVLLTMEGKPIESMNSLHEISPWPQQLRFEQLAFGDDDVCGILSDGTLFCWGESLDGIISGAIKAVAMGGNSFCSISTDNEALCFDDSMEAMYQLGSPPIGHYTDVSVGADVACAIQTNGNALCWGSPHSYTEAYTPPVAHYADISMGWYHGCGVTINGGLLCWGSNYYGEATNYWTGDP
jgi:alpha-tubulin suppressor-like RCC1 family protein